MPHDMPGPEHISGNECLRLGMFGMVPLGENIGNVCVCMRKAMTCAPR